MSKKKVFFSANLLLELRGSCFFACYSIVLESLVTNKNSYGELVKY